MLKTLKFKLPVRMRPAFMVMTISLLYLGVSFFMPVRKFKTPDEANKSKPTFSRLTVTSFLPDVGYVRWVKCKCECGKKIKIRFHSFMSGRTRSCGCYHTEVVKSVFCKYVGSNKSLYTCYKGMMDRCYKTKSKFYKNYGAVGVRVCREWKNNYQSFLDWALANGWRKGLQLDKDIKYVKKFPKAKRGLVYSPDFCQFVTCQENRRVTSRSVYIKHNGEKMLISEFCLIHNIHRDTLAYRIRVGYSIDEAIALRKHSHRNKKTYS